MPDYEVGVSIMFDVEVTVRDCADDFMAMANAEEEVISNMQQYWKEAWISVDAYESVEIEKGGESC